MALGASDLSALSGSYTCFWCYLPTKFKVGSGPDVIASLFISAIKSFFCSSNDFSFGLLVSILATFASCFLYSSSMVKNPQIILSYFLSSSLFQSSLGFLKAFPEHSLCNRVVSFTPLIAFALWADDEEQSLVN